jgi:hypothetical protein
MEDLTNLAPVSRDIVFVVGMSRNGTSAITRVLSLCGLGLPQNLLEANTANPAGFWESADVVLLNERFLRANGSSWCDPSLRIPLEFEPSSVDAAGFIDEIAALLRTNASSGSLVIKDPRLAAVAPFWFFAAEREGLTVRIILPVRHPYEVAGSLATRDGISFELAQLLWLNATFTSELTTRRFPRIFVEYANVMADWRTEVDRISAALGIDLSTRDEAAIDAFLNPSLHRERASVQPEGLLLPDTLDVYRHVSAAARGKQLDAAFMDERLTSYAAATQPTIRATQQADEYTLTLGLLGGKAQVGEDESIAQLLQERDALVTHVGELTAIVTQAQAQASQMQMAVQSRFEQWAAAVGVPTSGPAVVQRKTTGFEPDGWVRANASFTIEAIAPIGGAVVRGWIPAGGPSTVTVTCGSTSVAVDVAPEQFFSCAIDLDLSTGDERRLDLRFMPPYRPDHDDRELGCVIAHIEFA